MKNNMLTTKALKVVVAVVALWDITSAMPLEPEPRQFVYQPGSPSVRLYPVHFELYLKSSSGRFHVTEAQGFLPNMLPAEKEKTERTESEVTPAATITTPAPMTTKTTISTTTTSTTTTTATTSEHRMVPVTTMEPMMTLMEMTTMPEVTEEEGESLAESRTEQPTSEAVTEIMVNEREEANDGTELTPTMMKDEEEEMMEAVTELNNEGDETMMEEAKETMAEAEATATEEEAVTELMGEEETVTEVPGLREDAMI